MCKKKMEKWGKRWIFEENLVEKDQKWGKKGSRMKFQETDEGGQVGCRIRSDVTDIEFFGCRMSFDTTDDVNAGFDPAKRKKEKENARGVGSGEWMSYID